VAPLGRPDDFDDQVTQAKEEHAERSARKSRG
jgi:hypothetical protein